MEKTCARVCVCVCEGGEAVQLTSDSLLLIFSFS